MLQPRENKSMKVGAVSYLNTKPLVFGLQSHDFKVIYDLPSRLADNLAMNQLDVALIPVIEAITNPNYTIVSDACIACRGPVRSVKLFSRTELSRISSLAVDEGSRTSAALTKILLARRFGVRPIIRKLSINACWWKMNTDAVLVIGDRAMSTIDESTNPYRHSVDLGDYWNQWTGLPFVFAVWAARTSSDLARLDQVLTSTRDGGLRNIDKICEQHCQSYGMSISECREYLTEHLHFYLGHEERRGLELFLSYGKQLNFIEPEFELNFYDCPIA